MKKRIVILTLLLMLTINGCDTKESITVNVKSSDNEITQTLNSNVLGVSALKKICNGLWYDTTTGVVYWWNGFLSNISEVSTPPTPYYSSNGLIYIYIPETNTMKEVRGGQYEQPKEIVNHEN